MTMDEMQDRIEATAGHAGILSSSAMRWEMASCHCKKGDRVYRDLVGNLSIGIASKAERVDRIICQIPQQIK